MNWNEESPVIQAARRVVLRLREAGEDAYWVGGCVRDALLGDTPKDVDVATSALPDRVRALFPKHVSVGAHFGVILALEENATIEVATFRTDGEYLDARRPVAVHFGRAEEDAARRDFTINALFYDPLKDAVLDFTGGKDDIEARLIRAIGDPEARFREDALRLLRAVRFSTRFDFRIEPATLAALKSLAETIRRISPERVREELARIFTGPRRGAGLRLLDETGLLEHVLPEVAEMKDVPQPEEFHPEGDVFTHTVLALDALPPDPNPTLAFGTLLHDVGKPPTMQVADRIRFNLHCEVGAGIADAVCRRLRFSNADRKQIVALVDRHMQFMNIQEMRPATLRRFLGIERFEEHLELHRADCLASHRNLDNFEYCLRKIEEFGRPEAQPALPPPLINGHVLIAEGYRPGPRMGEILRALREAQLDGVVGTPEEALSWVRERYQRDLEIEAEENKTRD